MSGNVDAVLDVFLVDFAKSSGHTSIKPIDRQRLWGDVVSVKVFLSQQLARLHHLRALVFQQADALYSPGEFVVDNPKRQRDGAGASASVDDQGALDRQVRLEVANESDVTVESIHAMGTFGQDRGGYGQVGVVEEVIEHFLTVSINVARLRIDVAVEHAHGQVAGGVRGQWAAHEQVWRDLMLATQRGHGHAVGRLRATTRDDVGDLIGEPLGKDAVELPELVAADPWVAQVIAKDDAMALG